MERLIAAGLMAMALVCGCSAPAAESYAEFDGQSLARAPAYGEPPALTASLFKSDQAVLEDEAVDRILTSDVRLPGPHKIAVMRFPESGGMGLRYYGSYYWRSEDYRKAQQAYIDTISQRVGDSDRISQVILLPSLLTPSEVTIPVLREAAVRLQAELLLVFRINSDIYYHPRVFIQDQVKAYSTCEAVLLHVRTGVIPFTSIVTKEQMATREKSDVDVSETMRRAETAAVLASLNAISDELVAFLDNAPKPVSVPR